MANVIVTQSALLNGMQFGWMAGGGRRLLTQLDYPLVEQTTRIHNELLKMTFV